MRKHSARFLAHIERTKATPVREKPRPEKTEREARRERLSGRALECLALALCATGFGGEEKRR